MKLRIIALSLFTVVLTSCSETFDCPVLGNSDFREYFGTFSDYGSQLTFLTTADTLSYPLRPNFSEPYTCTEKPNVPKNCDCDASKDLSDDLPATSNHRFAIDYNAMGHDIGSRILTVSVRVDELDAQFSISERETLEERLSCTNGDAYYSNDTTVKGRKYARVLVAGNFKNSPGQQLLLSRDQGLIGFTEASGKQWYRAF